MNRKTVPISTYLAIYRECISALIVPPLYPVWHLVIWFRSRTPFCRKFCSPSLIVSPSFLSSGGLTSLVFLGLFSRVLRRTRQSQVFGALLATDFTQLLILASDVCLCYINTLDISYSEIWQWQEILQDSLPAGSWVYFENLYLILHSCYDKTAFNNLEVSCFHPTVGLLIRCFYFF